MRALLIACASLAAVSCSQPAGQQPATPAASAPSEAANVGTNAAPAPPCSLTAARDWSVAGHSFVLEASLIGRSCQSAAALYVVRQVDGRVLYADALPVNDAAMAFNPAADEATMRRDLNSWLDDAGPGAPQNTTAAALPAWPEGAERPPQFGPTIDRESYEAARAGRYPLRCYADEPESATCFVYDPAHNIVVGLGHYRPEAT